MARSRTIVIAGAGIGGLTAALALTRAGFRAVVLEQAARLEETGAGIQLSPNATRVLFDLGLAERLRPLAVAPEAIRVVERRIGPRHRARAARRGGGAALRRALLGDPSRRPAGRARDHDRGKSGRDLAARHARGGFRGPSARRDRRGARRARAARRTRHRADRRRRAVVDLAHAARRPQAAALRPPHRVARGRAGGAADGRIPRARHRPLARARRASGALPGERRARDQHRGDRARRLARAGLERARPAGRACRALRAFRAAGARADRDPRALAEMGAVRSARPAARAPRIRSRCSAMPPIRCCRSWRRAARWRSRTRRCWRIASRATRTSPARCALTSARARARVARAQREARRNSWRYHLAGPLGLARNACLAAMGGEKLLRRYDWLYGWRHRSNKVFGETHVRDDDRRQPAEARLARRAEQALAAVARAQATSSPPPRPTRRCSR